MKLNILLLWFCLLTVPAFSQVFKGKITAENGDPIPYATLYIHEISSGFTTDNGGYFHATLTPGRYTCEVSSLGYIRQVITVDLGNRDLEKNIVLQERIYQLREVSVTKNNEDPAYTVIRQAIAYAPYYRTYVRSYTAGTYLKGTGKVHSIPKVMKISKSVREDAKKYVGRLFVLEEQRKVTFTAPNTWDNEVKAYSNSFPDEIQVTLETTNINLYQPTLFGKISPLSSRAFSYYQFKLEGCYTEGEHLVNKIRVIPRKNNPELISGYLYVIENLWCLSAVDLNLSYSGFKASVKVTCKEIRPSVFLNTSASLKADISVMGIKAEASYLSAIHYTNVDISSTSILTNEQPVLTKKQQKIREQIDGLAKKDDLTTRDAYRLSKLVAKSLEEADTTRVGDKYERKTWAYDAKKDSLAERRDSVYWAAVRSVPLKPEEVQSYAYKEKLKALDNSGRKDSMNGKGTFSRITETLLFGKRLRTPDKKAWLNLGPLRSYIPEYNFVDGLWVGAKLAAGIKLGANTQLSFTPEVYYTTARKAWVGSGVLVLDYAPRYLGKLSLSGGVLSADFNGESGESRLINAISSLYFGQNDMKFYDKRFLSVENNIEITNGLQLTTGFTWQKRNTLENTVHHSLFDKDAKSNLPRHPEYIPMSGDELTKASVVLRYTPPRYYWMYKGRKIYDPSDFPTLTFKYERAFARVGSNTLSPSFHLTEFSAEQEFEFGLFNRIKWFANAGAFWDVSDIQFPDYKHFTTTRIPATEHSFDKGLALLDNYAYSTHARWAQANLSWSTPYLLLKQLPFLKSKRFDEALHLRSLVVYQRTPYWEAGYSVGYSGLFHAGIFVGFEYMRFHAVGVSISLPLLKLAGE